MPWGVLRLRPDPLTFWALGGGGSLGGPGGLLGRGTPIYTPQNEPLVALVILNTHMSGF